MLIPHMENCCDGYDSVAFGACCLFFGVISFLFFILFGDFFVFVLINVEDLWTFDEKKSDAVSRN